MSNKINDIFIENIQEIANEKKFNHLFDADACQTYIGQLMREVVLLEDLIKCLRQLYRIYD